MTQVMAFWAGLRDALGMTGRAKTLRQCLLETRLSVLLECHPEALPLLIDDGFTPLAHPALRAVLASTVTLAQALRLKPLAPAREEALLIKLEEVCACRTLAS